MKGAILCCDAVATLAFLWFALIILGVIEGNRTMLYITGIVGVSQCKLPSQSAVACLF